MKKRFLLILAIVILLMALVALSEHLSPRYWRMRGAWIRTVDSRYVLESDPPKGAEVVGVIEGSFSASPRSSFPLIAPPFVEYIQVIELKPPGLQLSADAREEVISRFLAQAAGSMDEVEITLPQGDEGAVRSTHIFWYGWVINGLFVLMGMLVLELFYQRCRRTFASGRSARNLCPDCGYDLRAVEHPRCPECGCQTNEKGENR